MAADFVSRRTLLATFVFMLTLALSISNTHASTIVIHVLESPAIAKNMLGISSKRYIQVYLPDGYEEGNQRYPVLYFIPGWAGVAQEGSFFKYYLDDAIRSAKIPPTIVVSIDVREGIMFLNSPVWGYWEDFMISELIPFIDREYRTIPDSLARGLTGSSFGGYTALILPVRNPDIWGSIGSIDPALWDWELGSSREDWVDLLKFLPENLDGYRPFNPRMIPEPIQLATALSPNPEAPFFCDFPVTPDGQWIPEIRERFIGYDLSNPETIAKNSKTLKDLLCIVIITPTEGIAIQSSLCAPLFNQMQEAGIGVIRLDMPGGHNDYYGERFIVIAEHILGAMIGAEVSVSPRGKVAALWGEIKN